MDACDTIIISTVCVPYLLNDTSKSTPNGNTVILKENLTGRIVYFLTQIQSSVATLLQGKNISFDK